MESSPAQQQKAKNSILSVVLIAVNVLLALVLATTIHEDDDPDNIMVLVSLAFSSTILLGGYAFTYHGKEHRWAKIVFGIVLVISLAFIGLLWYAFQLGKGFNH